MATNALPLNLARADLDLTAPTSEPSEAGRAAAIDIIRLFRADLLEGEVLSPDFKVLRDKLANTIDQHYLDRNK